MALQEYNTPGYTAGMLEEYGRLMPSTSRMELIVFALNEITG
jgi:hypothetical protein